MSEPIRIQKYFSDCGIMSRRQAEEEISAGNVSVNGVIALLGDKIDPDSDIVTLNGNIVKKSSSSYSYVMLNKPCGYVTTLSDEKGRHNVSELVAGVNKRLYPIGRLDMYSDGLLLLCDDGELTNKLTHPSHNISKLYRLWVMGEISDYKLSDLQNVTELDGYKLRKYIVEKMSDSQTDNEGRVYTELLFTLFEGRNREIRKICKKCGVKIIKLTRISIGDLVLGDLPTGKWRYLSETEVNYLKNI